jgi:hypothetical protein
MPWRFVIVADGHAQEGSRDVYRGHDDPGTVIARTHIPAAVREHPILTVVEEEIGGHGWCWWYVLDLWGLRDDDQGRWGRELNADVHVDLRLGGRHGQADDGDTAKKPSESHRVRPP